MDWNIFISYARLDDQPVDNGEGRVTQLRKSLEAALPQAVGRKIKVWQDTRDIKGNQYFSDEIDEALASCSVLLPIVSPSYVEDVSGYLRQEREFFISAAARNGGFRLGPDSRICPVMLRRTPIEKLPESVRQLNIKHVLTDEQDHDLISTAYVNKIRDLSNDLAEMLIKFSKTTPALSFERSPTKVYLACPTPDLKSHTSQIKAQLEEDGYEVLPSDAMASGSTADSDLRQCCVSIHPIGYELDGAPAATQQLIRRQFDMARQQRTQGLKQFVWMQRFLDLAQIAKASSEAWAGIFQDMERPANFVFNRDPLEGLLSVIGSHLKKLIEELQREEPAIAVQPDGDLPPGVMKKAYFACDPADLPRLRPIEQRLLKQDWWAEFEPCSVGSAEYERLHAAHLRDCQAYVIYYGKTKKEWVDIKRSDYRKANISSQRLPLYSQWIYFGPEEDPEKRSYWGPKEYFKPVGDFKNPFTDEFIEILTTTRPVKHTDSGKSRAAGQ